LILEKAFGGGISETALGLLLPHDPLQRLLDRLADRFRIVIFRAEVTKPGAQKGEDCEARRPKIGSRAALSITLGRTVLPADADDGCAAPAAVGRLVVREPPEAGEHLRA